MRAARGESIAIALAKYQVLARKRNTHTKQQAAATERLAHCKEPSVKLLLLFPLQSIRAARSFILMPIGAGWPAQEQALHNNKRRPVRSLVCWRRPV